MKLYDAHNHLQDDRFAGRQAELLRETASIGVAAMVVNGSCESDWPDVEALARQSSMVIPSYGLHPWYHGERSRDWLDGLAAFLDRAPSAVGEIGLDRWKEDLPYEEQEGVFLEQLALACRLDRPVSIHCLKAWGRLLELLNAHPVPAPGFLLHSYGGPAEMAPAFARRGAYFSFPGFYAHERKARQRDAFRQIPVDRLLVETDAPDQGLPDELNKHPMQDSNGTVINHPANIEVVYRVLADVRGIPRDELAARVSENFTRLFGAVFPVVNQG